MAAASSPHNPEDDPTSDSQYYIDESDPSHHDQDTPMRDVESKSGKESHPMQKRRRVTRACDECRRKKIKCDGKQPCTHCTVYSYECSYDQPSNRRRNPAPQYVEALETRLHKAEALLRVVLPDINLDDPQFDLHATEQMLSATKKEPERERAKGRQSPTMTSARRRSISTHNVPSDPGDESLLDTMVDNSGFLDMDDQGHWDYHGHTSGVIFIRRLRKQLGAPEMPSVGLKSHAVSQMLESPKSVSDSPQDAPPPPTHDLPSRAVARRLCHNALDDACSLMRFVHEPSFFAMLDRVYDTPVEQFTNEENSFLPLLYIAMSVGCLFSDDGASTLDISGYERAIGQGFQFFKAGRQLLEITDCRDLTSLQAVCFMVLFLQSSAKLSTCYSYVGIAVRAALRLGLHRAVATDRFNPVERELRKRIFWVVRKMDIYVSTMVGLPIMLSDDDIDQEYPLAIDGDFIRVDGITPMPTDRTPLMAGPNAHTRLSKIIQKVVKYIYPVKKAQYRSKSDQHYVVSHSQIREIERDLQAWMEELPVALRPGTEVCPQLERIRQLLRISYAHVQMVMYRPFLHYVSSGSQARGVDKRSYACAAACVSVSRNIVHITTGMHKRGLLNGSFWFTMYTTYFAILSLIFFVLENPDSPTAKDGVLKDAMEGKNTLAGLAKKSMAADRCAQSLNCLFKNLPELLKNRQSSVAPVNLKRPAPSSKPAPVRAATLPNQLLSRSGKAEASHAPKSLDDSQASHRNRNNPTQNNGQRTPGWLASTPELQTDSISTPSDTLPADRMNTSPTTINPLPSSVEQPGLPLSHLQSHPGNFPDLMPIMFPSDDPFAYPTQPMSTLEDGHFRQDGTGASSTPFPFTSSTPMPATNTPGLSGVSTPAYDAFANLPMFPRGAPPPTTTTVPSQQQQPPARRSKHVSQNSTSRLQSPGSHGASTPTSETVQSPDLVSIPNQNFLWNGYHFHDVPSDQTVPQQQQQQQQQHPQQQQQQPMPPANGPQNFGMGMDDGSSFGMGIDLGIPLDDLFGNGDLRGSMGNVANDDWIQWMNVGGA